MANDPDERLLTEARGASEGDLRAFEQLVLEHQRRIVADCRYMTRDPDMAEDLAQEVFVKAYFGLRRFEGRSSFRHWLQRIKVHHCINHLKKDEGQKRTSIEDVPEASERFHAPPAVYRELEAMDTRQRVAAILDSMPATLRVPLVMRDMDELSYEEIAEELGIGLSAAKMRIKRGREEFRQRYELWSAGSSANETGTA